MDFGRFVSECNNPQRRRALRPIEQKLADQAPDCTQMRPTVNSALPAFVESM